MILKTEVKSDDDLEDTSQYFYNIKIQPEGNNEGVVVDSVHLKDFRIVEDEFKNVRTQVVQGLLTNLAKKINVDPDMDAYCLIYESTKYDFGVLKSAENKAYLLHLLKLLLIVIEEAKDWKIGS